jgi:16S rRNA C1402 (ribose-2'-O) methylase RsmI
MCIARELTKKFETVLHGTALELHAKIQDTLKGEIVYCIAADLQTQARQKCHQEHSED